MRRWLTVALWGAAGIPSETESDPLATWRQWATDVRGRAVDCGHYLADYNRQPTKPYLDGETRYENSHRNFTMPRPAGPTR